MKFDRCKNVYNFLYYFVLKSNVIYFKIGGSLYCFYDGFPNMVFNDNPETYNFINKYAHENKSLEAVMTSQSYIDQEPK